MNRHLQELARDVSRAFEGATRPNGDEYRRLKEGSPEWMTDLVREAHGRDAVGGPAMLPDDHRYAFVEAAVDAIADADENADLDDVAAELEPDIYTNELTDWLGSNLARPGYVDEARAEWGDEPDTVKMLALGQLAEMQEVFQLVRAFLEARAEEDDEPDDD